MDNKTIFVRTAKGEEETQNRTSHLAGDVKRALLMVDGNATFGEISKRSAPSMRANLAEMFQELEKSGLIQDKSFVGKIPKMAVPTNMIVPGKIANPRKKQAVDPDAGELDFMSGFTAPVRPAPSAEAKAGKLKAEAEEKARQQIEAEKLKARKEAEAILHKAEQEAARIREETVRRAKEEAEAARIKAEQEAKRMREAMEAAKLKAEQEAEAARLKAEQEAKRVREELEAARLRAEQEARLRLEAAEREQREAEAARVKAEQEAKRVREELEAARLRAEQEVRLRVEAEEKKHREAEAARVKAEQEAARVKAEQEAAQMKIELEISRRRAELEAAARLEAEAKSYARIKAEEEAEKARDEAERLAKQELEEAQAREAAGARSTQATDAEKFKEDTFEFDAFQIDESQHPAESQKKSVPAQKDGAGQNAKASKKRDTFAFDAFDVDEQKHLPETRKVPPPAPKSAPVPPRDTAKAPQPADVREPVQQQVPAPVERKPDKEQIEREAQERIAAEQRKAEEAKAKELADVQEKVWAEAEQRALEAARANTERMAHLGEHPHESDRAEKPVSARVRAKPFAWGKLAGFFIKLGIILLVLLIGALFIVPYVLPMRDYMPKVQQLLSDRLHQPVHLGYLSGRILPMPRLDLGEIYIGDAKQFQADKAQINFEIFGVFGDKKPISSVEFQDVKVRGIGLKSSVAWLQQLAGDKQYPVSRMSISQGTLDADALQLTGVEGELSFSPAGMITHARLAANGGKYSMDITAAPDNKLMTSISVRGSALPLLPNWTFDELNARGELSNDELLISDFDAKILGGIMQGNAIINWRSGWRAQGSLNAKTITMNNLSKLLDGNIEGAARFKMTSLDLAGLTDSVALDGSFTSSDGMIGGMDIVETARMHSKENLPGGRTHYDKLSGDISYFNGTYHFKQVKIDAGVLDATATFDINKQQLSGKMKVNLSMHDGITADLQMGGAIDNPTLLYVP